MEIINERIEKLVPYEKNAKKHPDKQIKQIANSIKEFGWGQPIVVDKNNTIIVGHGRYEAAKWLQLKEIPILKVNLTEEQTKAYRLADNKSNESEWDMDLVIEELKGLSMEMIDLTGFDLDFIIDKHSSNDSKLADRFIVPPFSVLDRKQGEWQERKREWISLGIKSEKGRNENLLNDNALMRSINKGTSIFDPVLCEIMYLWFNIKEGKIYDPFAGGSVRGVIAEKLGYKYEGIELRKEQVEANIKNAAEVGVSPTWYCDDSLNVDKYIEDKSIDMIFSCPPYADLEKYCDDERDLSNMDYKDFKSVYFEIIKKACAKLKENRFAVFVVGEVRDKNGEYYNFVGDTIKAFQAAGLSYYNEIILLNVIGTACVRAGKYMNHRKVAKIHQNVLVFYKGDPKEIKKIYPKLEINIENTELNDK